MFEGDVTTGEAREVLILVGEDDTESEATRDRGGEGDADSCARAGSEVMVKGARCAWPYDCPRMSGWGRRCAWGSLADVTERVECVDGARVNGGRVLAWYECRLARVLSGTCGDGGEEVVFPFVGLLSGSDDCGG